MTACYTGASLAKKTIFAKHYKPLKYPVYTLALSIDKFIRDFYRGGRVEISWVEKVDPKTFYGFVSVEVKSRPSMVGEKKPRSPFMA